VAVPSNVVEIEVSSSKERTRLMEEPMELLQVVRESESQASRVGTLAPLRYQLSDQVPDGRDADFPLRRHDER
jgi:hypothetical protein